MLGGGRMGNRLMCATTPKSIVSQGGANTSLTGAPPPPPPTGVGGGGVAPHLSAVVVAQRISLIRKFSLRHLLKVFC